MNERKGLNAMRRNIICNHEHPLSNNNMTSHTKSNGDPSREYMNSVLSENLSGMHEP